MEGFEPSWVLVVTWVNVAPDDGCRNWNTDYYDYWYTTESDGQTTGSPDPYCRKQAEKAAVSFLKPKCVLLHVHVLYNWSRQT